MCDVMCHQIELYIQKKHRNDEQRDGHPTSLYSVTQRLLLRISSNTTKQESSILFDKSYVYVKTVCFCIIVLYDIIHCLVCLSSMLCVFILALIFCRLLCLACLGIAFVLLDIYAAISLFVCLFMFLID